MDIEETILYLSAYGLVAIYVVVLALLYKRHAYSPVGKVNRVFVQLGFLLSAALMLPTLAMFMLLGNRLGWGGFFVGIVYFIGFLIGVLILTLVGLVNAYRHYARPVINQAVSKKTIELVRLGALYIFSIVAVALLVVVYQLLTTKPVIELPVPIPPIRTTTSSLN